MVRRKKSGLLDQVQERFLAPLEIVEEDHERALCRRLRENLADRPGDLVGRCGRVRLAEERADRAAAASSSGRGGRAAPDLDDRQVGDAFAVGRAAALDHGRLDRPRNSAASRDLPTPASPTTVTSSQRRIGPHESQLSRRNESSALRPTNGPPGRLSASSPTRKRRWTGSVLQEWLDRLGVDRDSNELQGRLPDQDLAGRRGLHHAFRRADNLARRDGSLAGHDLPVITPIRPASPSSANAARASSAARTARNASSSCTTGTPKTAITASPITCSSGAVVARDDRPHVLEEAGDPCL